MKISNEELRRIAEICKLEFSGEEYDALKSSLENTIEESMVLFSSNSFDMSIKEDFLNTEDLENLAKQSFSYLVPKNKN